MRRNIVLVFLLLLLLTVFSCSGKKPDKDLVVVTIYPYELLVRQLTGNALEVKTLIPPNASPHTWSPRPSDLQALEDADLIVSNGLGLETYLQSKLDAAGNRQICLAELLGIKAPEEKHHDEAEHHDEDEQQHEHAVNPHLWLSPRYLIQMTEKLSGILSNKYPVLKESISKNTKTLLGQLADLDARIKMERATLGDVALISYHDSFHWFLEDYSIRNLGSVQSSPGREPTPQELKTLGNLIQSNQIKAISVEPQMDRRSANVLAKEFDLKIIELDPLGTSLQPPPVSVVDVIAANWQNMKQGWQ